MTLTDKPIKVQKQYYLSNWLSEKKGEKKKEHEKIIPTLVGTYLSKLHKISRQEMPSIFKICFTCKRVTEQDGEREIFFPPSAGSFHKWLQKPWGGADARGLELHQAV